MVNKMIKSKKADANWYVISLVLAMIVFVIYSFITQGAIYNFMQGIGIVDEETDLKIGCLVPVGSEEDKDGDGFADDDIVVDGVEYECSKLKKDSLV